MSIDKKYILDLCDEILGVKASREHVLDNQLTKNASTIAVGAYYPEYKLAIEITRRQPSPEGRLNQTATSLDIKLFYLDKRVLSLNNAGRIRPDQDDREIVRSLLRAFLKRRLP